MAENIQVSPLNEETFEVRGYYLDEIGKPVSDDYGPVRVFTANLSMSRLQDIAAEWADPQKV